MNGLRMYRRRGLPGLACLYEMQMMHDGPWVSGVAILPNAMLNLWPQTDLNLVCLQQTLGINVYKQGSRAKCSRRTQSMPWMPYSCQLLV